jgi:hypothetical protein
MARALKKQRMLEYEAKLFHDDIFGPTHRHPGFDLPYGNIILDFACGLHCWTHVHVHAPSQKADLLASASNQRAHINREQS